MPTTSRFHFGAAVMLNEPIRLERNGRRNSPLTDRDVGAMRREHQDNERTRTPLPQERTPHPKSEPIRRRPPSMNGEGHSARQP
jgi:hypothetical protein